MITGWLSSVSPIEKSAVPSLALNRPALLGELSKDYEDYVDAADRISPLNSVLFSNALAKKVGIYEGIPDQDARQSTMIAIGKSLLSIDDTVISGLTAEINDHVFM